MKKKYFLIIFLLLPFMIPDYLFNFEIISAFVKIWRLLTGAWVALYMVLRKKVDKVLLLVSTFYFIMIVSGVIHKVFNISVFMDLSLLWIMFFLTSDYERQTDTFQIMKKILSLFILINFMTMIVFPNGLYTTQYELNWFLGYKNGLIRKILPYLLIIFMNNQNKKLSIFDKIMVCISIITILISKSVTSIFGILLFIILCVVFKNKKNVNIKLHHILVVYIIIDVLLLYTNLFTNITNIINIQTGRQTTMGARYMIWSASKNAVKQSPIIGYGAIKPEFYDMIPFEVSHPHNLLLNYLLNGGIACVIILYFSMIQIDRHLQNRKYNKLFISYYITSLLMAISESLIGAVFFIPFLLVLYNMNKVNSKITMKGE